VLDDCASREGTRESGGDARFGARSERACEWELAPKGAARGSPVVEPRRPAHREPVLNPSPASCPPGGPTSRDMVMSLMALPHGLTRKPEDVAGSRAVRPTRGKSFHPLLARVTREARSRAPRHTRLVGVRVELAVRVIPMGAFDAVERGTLYK
jgi:hypothetical protein